MHRNRDDRLNELEDAGTVTVSSRYGGSSFTDIWDSTNIEVRIAVWLCPMAFKEVLLLNRIEFWGFVQLCTSKKEEQYRNVMFFNEIFVINL